MFVCVHISSKLSKYGIHIYILCLPLHRCWSISQSTYLGSRSFSSFSCTFLTYQPQPVNYSVSSAYQMIDDLRLSARFFFFFVASPTLMYWKRSNIETRRHLPLCIATCSQQFFMYFIGGKIINSRELTTLFRLLFESIAGIGFWVPSCNLCCWSANWIKANGSYSGPTLSAYQVNGTSILLLFECFT